VRVRGGGERPRDTPGAALWRGYFWRVAPASDLTFQTSLFDVSERPSFDTAFTGLERITLDASSWVDSAKAWVRGSDRLFEEIFATRDWGQRTRWMYEKRVREPRLTSPWSLHSGVPLEPRILEEMRVSLSQKYGHEYDSVGFNLYRDGSDSVAWHGDKILKEIEDPIVALVSVGEPRKFLLRPKGGGKSVVFQLGRGDLLVTGGATQRRWEHSVPKVAKAGPRISLAFRYGLDPRAYAHKTTVAPDR
jgi:alkylated DNA repair dioxygenase AlkB